MLFDFFLDCWRLVSGRYPSDSALLAPVLILVPSVSLRLLPRLTLRPALRLFSRSLIVLTLSISLAFSRLCRFSFSFSYFFQLSSIYFLSILAFNIPQLPARHADAPANPMTPMITPLALSPWLMDKVKLLTISTIATVSKILLT